MAPIRLRISKKGAATVEFVIILPLFILLAMVLWQAVVLGKAVLDTQAALRDAVKVTATTGDAEKGKEQGETSFGDWSNYQMKDFTVEIKGEEVIAKAETEVPMLFMKSSYTYTSEAQAPVVQSLNFYAGSDMPPIGTGELAPPVSNPIITSDYGMRWHPVRGEYRLHSGIDFGGPFGTPIYAAGDGIVRYAGWRTGYGYTIEIDHGGGLMTRYAHMESHYMKVSTGEQVTRGQHIAGIGSTGWSTGPHLHFEVLVNNIPQDPKQYIY
ncbi:peptidoglycan DD-metalloendopeptidase family protein [Desmospora profundinema]|uniref:Murein DD-endopeptidase MepM/ murein hydrolase activator NlpD n=1 Tax=Desmospora profundinema TaxID=1571184 RepID=A0ABU1IS99_9BACL|nr:peptidoglycan DD-metalloendopeptidase family protein [Desmospora profundinema]MDR6227064.1 murein DD-endopeptidase MepM/ murein hydrolase activator NlpD [Desmospora profundinema]